MNATDYNAQQLASGALTAEHVTELVKMWQAEHPDLVVDGKAGPATIATIARAMAPNPAPFLHCPLPVLPDGRRAVITSEFRPADRPNHDGVDWFYSWRPGDKPNFVGDHGAAGKVDGHPKWGVPLGTCGMAAAAGVVAFAGDSPTGHRLWIDHGNGWCTGYFHLLDLRVTVGQRVESGAPLGLIGDNPKDNDARHLHFELSPSPAPPGHYAPTDPVPFLLK